MAGMPCFSQVNRMSDTKKGAKRPFGTALLRFVFRRQFVSGFSCGLLYRIQLQITHIKRIFFDKCGGDKYRACK
jgi:hypothetical protein